MATRECFVNRGTDHEHMTGRAWWKGRILSVWAIAAGKSIVADKVHVEIISKTQKTGLGWC
jgi:hypothetical protein